MARSVKLVGLDCGSTTTSAVVAEARIVAGALGRMEVSDVAPIFRSEMVFTPFIDDRIDIESLDGYLSEWLKEISAGEQIFGGGALVTGLAARRTNAAAVTQLIESRLADSVVAAAGDPCLESWLAFMGNCHALSLAYPKVPILNLDIGGGTTNLALGIGGQVMGTGCLLAGARHFQFLPGSHELIAASPQAAALLEFLQIESRIGDVLDAREIQAIVNWYVELIEAAIEGRADPFETSIGRLHLQVAPSWPADMARSAAITLSGGVGQLAYDYRRDPAKREITQFGDLGGELAARLLGSLSLAARMNTLVPEGLGRATVYGLLRHATSPSGATLYLPRPERLPLRHVPVIGQLGPMSNDDQIAQVVAMAARCIPAAGIRVTLDEGNVESARRLGDRLGQALTATGFPPDRTLVVLVEANVGKAFGSFVTRWGMLGVDLIVVDEVPARDAQFVRLGQACEGTVPISLYGMR